MGPPAQANLKKILDQISYVFSPSERNKDGPRGKWFISKEEYPRDEYPPYCSGNAYLTTIGTMKIILPAIKNLAFNFIDDLLVTGLAVESANIDNLITNPENIVEIYDIAYVFHTMHLDDVERLLDENVGFFSPILIGAFDLSPQQVGLKPSYNLSQV